MYDGFSGISTTQKLAANLGDDNAGLLTEYRLCLFTRQTSSAYLTISERAIAKGHSVCLSRAGFNWWEAWGPVYLGGTERLQQLYD